MFGSRNDYYSNISRTQYINICNHSLTLLFGMMAYRAIFKQNHSCRCCCQREPSLLVPSLYEIPSVLVPNDGLTTSVGVSNVSSVMSLVPEPKVNSTEPNVTHGQVELEYIKSKISKPESEIVLSRIKLDGKVSVIELQVFPIFC